IQGILGQTYDDFEFLIHDGGSSDAGYDVALGYAQRDPRIVLTRSENKGVFATRNEMMSRATGEYLAVMDSDDIALPDRFAMQVAFLDAHPDHVCVGGQWELMDEDGAPLGPGWFATRHETIDARNLSGRVNMVHPAAMVRRSAMEQIGGYDGTLRSSGDLDLWLRLAEIGKIANLREIVLRYRLSSTSISSTRREEQAANAARVCQAAWERRGISGQFDPAGKAAMHDGASNDARRALALRYGWLAWTNNHRASWWKYATRALRAGPLSRDAWRLMVVGALKRPGSVQKLAPEA
ncbi:glycosyltransferase, partial [Escherichia coli]|nr:glycosyltransferase [Escherichia coli]